MFTQSGEIETLNLLKSKRFVLFMFIENVNLISSVLLKGVIIEEFYIIKYL